MDKEQVLLKVKQLGFDLEYNKISLKEYYDQVTYLLRYQWKDKTYSKNSNYFN